MKLSRDAQAKTKCSVLEVQLTLHRTDDGLGKYLWADREKGQRPFPGNVGELPLIL